METLYHALNRGVDKRIIFLDSQDYARFVHNLYECNTTDRLKNNSRRFSKSPMSHVGGDSSSKLVDIHGWCLMKNHFHLILSERTENGISLFLQRINVGYVKYFNEKYNRSGTLYQGKTKRIPIQSESHFYHILHYVHLNPLDYLDGAKDWRERSVQNLDAALAQIQNYKWSSYLDYCDIHNFPSILTKEIFNTEFPDYTKELLTYLKGIAVTR